LEKKKLNLGFTVLEVLIVVLVLGILAAVAGYNYQRYALNAKRVEAITNLGVIRGLEETYRAENSRYVTCDWSPREIPPPEGTTDWNNSSYFYLIGFSPRGVLRYRYGVSREGGTLTIGECLSNSLSCYNGGVVENGFVSPRDGYIDIIIKAEGDLDGDGEVGKIFVPDEPPARVVYLNYAVY
jgi:prepilin-type N-terminal cleavage/methylation domain-containing protein